MGSSKKGSSMILNNVSDTNAVLEFKTLCSSIMMKAAKDAKVTCEKFLSIEF